MIFLQTAALAKFWRLPPDERRLLVLAGTTLIAARLGLWVLPFKAARRLALGASKLVGGPATMPPARVAWAIARTSRFVPRASCLAQAVAAESLLKVMGCPVTLRIGVAKPDNGSLKAHAWIESRGSVVVGGDGVERYWALSPGSVTELPRRQP
jgi:hypothetical protein